MKNMPHICTIEKPSSGSCLPTLSEEAGFWERQCRKLKKYMLVSDRDPRIIEYFRTTTGLMNEKRRQVESKYHYMIHPFSDIKNYIFGPYFFCDVISCLPTDIYGYMRPESSVAYCMHYLRLFKLVRLKTFLKCFDRISVFIRWNKIFLVIIRYCLIVGIIVHWVACLNFFLPQLRVLMSGTQHKYSWTHVINRRPPMVKYLVCLFRTAGLVLAALSSQPDNFPGLVNQFDGKRDNPLPEEIETLVQTSEFMEEAIFNGPTEEILLDFFNIIIGKIFTSAFAVIIISRIFERYTLETKYQAIMNQLNEFMKNKKLPLAMRDRLVQYYEHRYQKKYFKEEVITAILSENLRKEVNINVCRQLVNVVNIFSELPPNILSDVLGHLKAEVYLPNDIIIKAGTVGDCMYFLASGTVSVYTPSGREVCHLQDGAYFGEIALILKNTKRTTDIIAIEVCEVYRLDKKAFRSCFKYDRYGVFEKMQQIAEQRLQKTALLEETYKLELFQKAYTEKL
ncbi:potassium/sodium hyperpolarization-activated cyclic nucleotide-gated channel 2-like isoform X2 [Coccinella septempunctata]|uniref:potassium/sodium hyperpolarization-activated cyclic nucleotide-gated channel 2-like isoform X2 n=1 Tax=Coccinella septempunctata TaxID=41139 RepID=UPI001D07EF0B|nr:potassium/sodium hyperpolarization-activated cyclic nucleotide-gated channel 2-like isoform X2 [Coccinella septempunctata]